jgi:hypothetical protein
MSHRPLRPGLRSPLPAPVLGGALPTGRTAAAPSGVEKPDSRTAAQEA